MRALAFVTLVLLLAGCSGSPPPHAPGDEAAVDDRPVPTVIAEGAYQLGLPATGPIQTSVGLGFVVPANATHLLVEVVIEVGASVGLRTEGVPGCEHEYPDPQAISEAPLVYECDTQPGAHQLRFSHQGGRLHFQVRVTASPPAVAPTA